MLSPEQLAILRAADATVTGNRLARAIELLGVRQADVAAGAQLSQPYVSAVAGGRHQTITVENAHRFAAYFGCSVEDLFPAREGVM